MDLDLVAGGHLAHRGPAQIELLKPDLHSRPRRVDDARGRQCRGENRNAAGPAEPVPRDRRPGRGRLLGAGRLRPQQAAERAQRPAVDVGDGQPPLAHRPGRRVAGRGGRDAEHRPQIVGEEGLALEFDDYLRPEEAHRRFARVPKAEVIGVDGAKHLWVGENYVRIVLAQIVRTVNPAALRGAEALPTTWDD